MSSNSVSGLVEVQGEGEGEEEEEEEAIPYDARIKLIVTFSVGGGEAPHVVVLSMADIDLPTQTVEGENSESTTPQKLTKRVRVSEELPKKVWKQFGSAVQEKLVVQVSERSERTL